MCTSIVIKWIYCFTLSIFSKPLSRNVAHLLQKFLTNATCVLFPGPNVFPCFDTTCKSLGCLKASTLKNRARYHDPVLETRKASCCCTCRHLAVPFGVFWELQCGVVYLYPDWSHQNLPVVPSLQLQSFVGQHLQSSQEPSSPLICVVTNLNTL